MNRNKKTKNVKVNKNIEYIELTNSSNTPTSVDNKENTSINNRETDSFS